MKTEQPVEEMRITYLKVYPPAFKVECPKCKGSVCFRIDHPSDKEWKELEKEAKELNK